MSFPQSRMRRLRRTESLRALVRETAVTPGDLIYPLFLCPGEGVRRPAGSMLPRSTCLSHLVAEDELRRVIKTAASLSS
jgi:delta-aminolevulinic acid dehydratase/porphobilinogen synthase